MLDELEEFGALEEFMESENVDNDDLFFLYYRGVNRLKAEIKELRKALLDALTVFEIDYDTKFHEYYKDVIKRANEDKTLGKERFEKGD